MRQYWLVGNKIAHFCLLPYNHDTMNGAQVKEIRLQLKPSDEYFEVVLSGKKSRKMDGLYKPESREIILHSGNFHSDNEMTSLSVVPDYGLTAAGPKDIHESR